MPNIFITLQLDLTKEAASGAGWYVRAAVDAQQAMPPTFITSEAASGLAGAFLTAMQSTDGELPQVTPPQLVESGNGLIKQALEDQLRYAEEQASRVGHLRRRLGIVP